MRHPLLVLALSAGLVAACVPLYVLTGELREYSAAARLEWETGHRSLHSKDRCAHAAVAGIQAAQREATYPAHVSNGWADEVRHQVQKECQADAGSSPEHPVDGGAVDSQPSQ